MTHQSLTAHQKASLLVRELGYTGDEANDKVTRWLARVESAAEDEALCETYYRTN